MLIKTLEVNLKTKDILMPQFPISSYLWQVWLVGGGWPGMKPDATSYNESCKTKCKEEILLTPVQLVEQVSEQFQKHPWNIKLTTDMFECFVLRATTYK